MIPQSTEYESQEVEASVPTEEEAPIEEPESLAQTSTLKMTQHAGNFFTYGYNSIDPEDKKPKPVKNPVLGDE